jgi:hypothetical protein
MDFVPEKMREHYESFRPFVQIYPGQPHRQGCRRPALIIVPATAKRPGLVEAPSWRFEAAGSRFYGRRHRHNIRP